MVRHEQIKRTVVRLVNCDKRKGSDTLGLKSVEDTSRGLKVEYGYDENGRETWRRYGNGVRQETRYDRAGRVTVIKETDGSGRIIRAEGYLYDEAGRRSHSVDEGGRVTKYEYDNRSRLKTVLYPYTVEKAEADRKEAEEAGLYFSVDRGVGERYMLGGGEQSGLRALLESARPGLGSVISVGQVAWRESHSYDRNGNRVSKSTPWGTIEYDYDAENRLIKKGDIVYTYDRDGNLLSEEGIRHNATYEYNGQNRMVFSQVTDQIRRTRVTSEYAYDALGRRTVVQDAGGTGMRTLYDGFSFQEIRAGETFTDGSLATRYGSEANTNRGTEGSRYRWIGEGENGTRTRSTGEYSMVTARWTGASVTLYGKGEAVAVNLSASAGSRGGPAYLGKDILGSVRSSTNEYGTLEDRYEYDAFGKPYQGDLTQGMNLGYTGKAYDAATGLYNYGYRDYAPSVARFTTVDPIRDGSNWFTYVNNDPVNYVDLWGLWIRNADGTYTAEAGDTLSGLSVLVTGSGNNWERYEFAGDPLKQIDPRSLQIGSVINVDNIIGFGNADQAAASIMPKINPTSQTEYVEYGGFTYQENGITYYTRPTTDQKENSWSPINHGVTPITLGASQYTLGQGGIVSGWYHTHPFVPDTNGQSKYNSEELSGWEPDTDSPTGYSGDKYVSDGTGLPTYMISPTYQMWKYTPSPTGVAGMGIVSPLQKCGH